jgi:DNA-binding NarL/FixJ family response regulator
MNGFLNTTKDEMIRSVTQENFDALLHGGKPDKSPRSRRKRRTSQTAKGLTPRQTEALEKVGECKGNWTQAGRLMSMTPKTVREHYFAAYRKLGMSAEAQIETLRTTAKNQQALTVFEELNPTIAGEDEGQAPSLQGKGRIRRDRRH